MPSPFVDQLLQPLDIPQPVFTTYTGSSNDSQTRRELQSLLLSLQQPLSEYLAQDVIGSLTQIERRKEAVNFVSDPESHNLVEAIIAKILVGLYAEGLDLCLSQATHADMESEWRAEIQRSRLNLVWYLLQTMPARFLNLTKIILHSVRSQNLPVSLETFSTTSFWRNFRSPDSHPNSLIKVLFPHLRQQGISVTSPVILSSTPRRAPYGTLLTRLWTIFDPLVSLAGLPIALTRQECVLKRKELEKVRDQRAETLGRLSLMRKDLLSSIKKPWDTRMFVGTMSAVLEGDLSRSSSPSHSSDASSEALLRELENLSISVFSAQKTAHQRLLDSRGLSRPSRLTLMWPKLVLLPPLCIYSLRSAYILRGTLVELARDARATVEGFVRGWLLEPIKEVLKTVRADSEGGMIIQKEGIEADFASLERMTLALAKDQLNYSSEQLAYLSSRIHVGDLTPVQQIYEEDIKRPLKSVVAGTLLRSVFIQVQKAKVDIDQALAGIDKLLKSQELTFAFVGVAPALSIVYLLSGSLITLWIGGSRRNKYGSRRRILGAWSALRRTERLLVTQPPVRGHKADEVVQEDPYSISPLTSGLMLLSVARLRTYAETCLPPRSHLREGFLEDVGDLENPDLSRANKIHVIDRMWRCWSEALGWGRIAVESNPGI